jgi:tRNA (guanine37-N1)-methyltransferase
VRIDIITIFPEYFGPLRVSLIGKAAERGDIQFGVHDLRCWATDVHRSVDDAPYGGGPGMVMTPGPWGDALDSVLAAGGGAPIPTVTPSPTSTSALSPTSTPSPTSTSPSSPTSTSTSTSTSSPTSTSTSSSTSSSTSTSTSTSSPTSTSTSTPAGGGGGVPARLVLPSPSGTLFTQERAAAYAAEPWLIFGCGRYEGIDARVAADARTRMPVDEVSIGDYVLAGGEPAVLVMVEAIARLLPGVMGNARSAADDSFGGGSGPMAGLLEGPVYTRPPVWREQEVPPVLLSGDHGAIARWRRDQALRVTAASRPDLAARLGPGLDKRDREVLFAAGFPVSGEDVAH